MTLPKPPPLPVDLDLEPFQVADREGDTLREGVALPPGQKSYLERYTADLRAQHQRELDAARLQIQALQQSLAQPLSEPPPDPDIEPAPETRPSLRVQRAQRAWSLGKALGKWSFLLGALPFIGAAVVKTWPQTAAPVDFVLQLLEQLR